MSRSVFNFLIIIMFFYSCSDVKDRANKKEDKQLKSYSQGDELKRNIIFSGSITDYDELCTKYIRDEKYMDIIPYSFIMATEYEHLESYYDIFFYLYAANSKSCCDYDLRDLDEQTKRIVLRYLRLGVEKGDIASSTVLLTYYDKGKHYPIEELYSDMDLVEKAKANVQKLE